MAWYHQYKYAEITSPTSQNALTYRKAFPILQMRIRDRKIKNVRILLQESPRIEAWFHWSEVRLYKAKSEWAHLPEQRFSANGIRKLIKQLTGRTT